MKKMMRYGLLGCMAIGASFTITSCDTREDWFQKEGEGATFVFMNGEKTDTIDLQSLRVVDYTVHLIGVDGYSIWSDTLNLQVWGMTNKTKIPAKIDRITSRETPSYANGGSYLPIKKVRMNDGSYNFYYNNGYEGLTLFLNPTVKEEANVIGSSDLFVQLKDIFENPYTAHIRIKYLSDCPPTPVLRVKDVAGSPKEKTLDLSESYDEDGTVVKYEYCIDGNIAPYKGTSNRFENVPGAWQSGKAAYGGTYITATSLSEVNHAFQEAGEHVVYYRCMDNIGAWSMWNKETITIK